MVLQVLRERFQRWHEQNYIPVAESDSEKAAEDLEPPFSVVLSVASIQPRYMGEIAQGSIYWDWSMDWMNLANSSIWNSETGFGGDGNLNSPLTVGGGRCVTDGPFSELRPIIYNHTFTEHCLSRGFRDGNTSSRLTGAPYSPESIGQILREPTYKEFVRKVEYYLHNTMHQSIAGDFLAMTAANDPIFFVHHVQLDHLWWRWQQDRLDVRLKEYTGKHMFNSTGEASLGDILMYGGFAEDVPVSKVMDTEGGFLCYRY
ncbi:MAG: hypothetical protein MMC33_007631 [Icmadophila ericetorum]|nr:hypothetical protein [Icmadophila ericetorum]